MYHFQGQLLGLNTLGFVSLIDSKEKKILKQIKMEEYIPLTTF